MDKATRELRRRNKALTGRRGQLPQFEARGRGQKNKPAASFPLKQCDHIDGGKVIWLRRKRADGSQYMVRLVKGGQRCPNTVIAGTNCLEHS